MGILASNVPGAIIQDRSWVRRSFMMAFNEVMDEDLSMMALINKKIKSQKAYQVSARFRSLVWRKYTSTRPGGNWTINNLPQFTPFADPRMTGLDATSSAASTPQNIGTGHMGEFYSDAYDDNSVRAIFQFGIPEYNGMLSFFTGFYDNDAAMLANDGVIQTIGYYIGRAAGLVVGIAMLPVVLLGSAVSFFISRPTSRYYYMREMMPLYWNRVNVIANSLAVNMGLVERVHADKFYDTADPEHNAMKQDSADMESYRKIFHRELGDIFLAKGGINVYALATKTQRMHNHRQQAIQNIMEAAQGDYEKAFAALTELESVGYTPIKRDADTDWDKFMQDYHANAWKQSTSKQTDAGASAAAGTELGELKAAEQKPGDEAAAKPTEPQEKGIFSKWMSGSKFEEGSTSEGWLNDNKFIDHYMSARADGGKFVYFRVDNPGQVSESFSNSFGRPSIVETINGISTKARDLRFSLSDGNTGFGIVDEAVGGMKSVAAGVLDSFHMAGLMSLAGSAFVDIPDRWENSSVSLPTANFTMELRSPYGHPLSRFLNMYLPLSMLLAGVMPISTGKASYTSPFLCSCFVRGRNIIRTGMIDSLSITRGSGNFGFTRDGECLAIDVSFSVKDLTSVMHAPIETGFDITRPWKGMLFDEENAFNDYMAVLGNLSLADMHYPLRKMMLNLTKKGVQVDTYFSKAHLASMLDEKWLTRWVGTTIGAFTRAGGGTL